MSHGQATVERGFSQNKEVASVNMSECTFVSKRIVCDYISAVGGVLSVKVTPEMLTYVCGARQRYMSYLDEQKRKSAEATKKRKRDSKYDELEELKAKKQRCLADIDGLEKSASKFADQAEHKGSLTLIAKSNSLRRTAQDKKSDLTKIESDIASKLEEIKNM